MPRLDMKSEKSERKIINTIREELSKYLYTCMQNEYGEDFVKYANKELAVTENASKVAKHTVIADICDTLDKDGCEVGVVAEVTVKVKKWNTVSKKNGGTQFGVCLDDYDVGEE